MVEQAAEEGPGKVGDPEWKHDRIAPREAGGPDDQAGHPGSRIDGTYLATAADAEEFALRNRRVDRTDLDAGPAQLAPQGVRQAGDGVLGRRVKGRIGRGPDAGYGG